jgi:hypothetical protein
VLWLIHATVQRPRYSVLKPSRYRMLDPGMWGFYMYGVRSTKYFIPAISPSAVALGQPYTFVVSEQYIYCTSRSGTRGRKLAASAGVVRM